MKSKYPLQVFFYKSISGKEPVREWLKNLWEIRSNLDDRIARVIFTICEDSIILLHGFIKKTQKIPASDLSMAKKRAANLGGGL